jgi:trans-2,3-dihydro-3-hydroxyanthranilate isomerase
MQAADGGYRTRIFTPAREIAFAGHPILGTAWVVRESLRGRQEETLRLNLPVGQVPVTFETAGDSAEVAWFAAPQVRYGETCAIDPMAGAIGLAPADIDDASPIQRFSAGTTSLSIVPLRTLDALQRCRLDLEAFAPLAARGFSPLVYAFCREARDARSDFSARFFFDAHGVREDPASGNAAAFLGHYLLEHRVVNGDAGDIAIEQGHSIGRPSLVRVRMRSEGGARHVSVGGAVVPVVRGELVAER